MPITAAIWDLDGTLCNTADDLCESFNKAAAIHGYPPRDVATFVSFVGSGARNLVKRSLPDGVSDDICATVYDDYMRIYSENLTTRTLPYEGIVEVLKAFAAKGIRMSVMSNKPDAHTKIIAAELFSGISFELVYGNMEGRPHKPDPEVPLEVAAAMGADPASTAFIGDSDVDMKTAVNAGMIPVGCSWGFRPGDVVKAAGAKYLFDRPIELMQLLDI